MAASEEEPEAPMEPLDIACGLENLPVSVWPPGAVPEPFQIFKDLVPSASLHTEHFALFPTHARSMLHFDTHPEKYTPEHVAGPGADADPAEITFPGCLCLHRPCVPGSCSCLRHAENYDADARLRPLGSAAGCSQPVFECNALCPCPEHCANRVVQRGVQLRLQVFRTPRKGWGLRTLEFIPRGRFVCEYAGEVLGFSEARRRIRLQTPLDANYIIAVREHVCGGPVMETFVDPAGIGNVGRFLNHSCEPNLLMVPVRVDSMVPKLALFAAKDIPPEEELSYDYSGRFLNRTDCEDRERPDGGKPRKPCYCGSKACAAFLPYDGSLYCAPEPPGGGQGGRAREMHSCPPRAGGSAGGGPCGSLQVSSGPAPPPQGGQTVCSPLSSWRA